MELVKVDGYKVISVKLPTIKRHKDTIEPLLPDWMSKADNCDGFSVEYEFSGADVKKSTWCVVKMMVKDVNNLKVKTAISTAKLKVVGKETDYMTMQIEAVK